MNTIVIALGGHALIEAGEAPSVAGQARCARKAVEEFLPLLEEGHRLVLTHGNGVQVGNILIRVQEAIGKAYPLPLDMCVAESQGELGFLLEQSLHNALADRHEHRPIAGVLTRVLVDAADPAFEHPTKPIGPAFDEEGAKALKSAGFQVVEQPGRGWYKVVASPRPLEILDVEVLKWLLERGAIVIAAGGGGIPVARGKDGRLEGVPAVVDKDLASALLAHAIGAETLLILTDEAAAYLDFGLPTQRPLRRLTPDEARRHTSQGHFPPGSMGPKIDAAVEFVEAGGTRALITSPGHLAAALRGEDGTTIAKA